MISFTYKFLLFLLNPRSPEMKNTLTQLLRASDSLSTVYEDTKESLEQVHVFFPPPPSNISRNVSEDSLKELNGLDSDAMNLDQVEILEKMLEIQEKTLEKQEPLVSVWRKKVHQLMIQSHLQKQEFDQKESQMKKQLLNLKIVNDQKEKELNNALDLIHVLKAQDKLARDSKKQLLIKIQNLEKSLSESTEKNRKMNALQKSVKQSVSEY